LVAILISPSFNLVFAEAPTWPADTQAWLRCSPQRYPTWNISLKKLTYRFVKNMGRNAQSQAGIAGDAGAFLILNSKGVVNLERVGSHF
jgi:hypothetical protein